MQKNNAITLVPVHLPFETRLRLRLLAGVNDTTMSNIVAKQIDKLFEKQKEVITPFVIQAKP
jgi:hypothetical protein